MRKVSVRVWGVGVWCVLGAACLARETESVGTAGAAGSGATGSAPLCGVENTERVSDIVCAVTADWCERLAGCCQASGFGGAAGDCRAQQGPSASRPCARTWLPGPASMLRRMIPLVRS